jgi:hemoglobin
MTSDPDSTTLYQRVGKEPFFVKLVDKFYEGVEQDEVLRPWYPDDLGPGKAHLAGFLSQYWGGPPNYSLERGHPALRMRHRPFSIGQVERDAWVQHMTEAVTVSDASMQDKVLMLKYFSDAGTFLMNRG